MSSQASVDEETSASPRGQPAALDAPPAEPSGGAADTFVERLEQLAERRYHHRHPFNLLMHAGRLDRGDLRLWVANRYYYQTRIPIKDALIVAKSEDQAFRRVWIQRLLDHDGRGDPRRLDPRSADAPPSSAEVAPPAGLELWRRLGQALGLSGRELEEKSELLPGARAACDLYVEAVRSADLVTAVASSLTEHFAPRLMQLRIEAWLQHYPFVSEGALDYFKQRVTIARGDADFALAFVRANAKTEAERQRCLDAFEVKCDILWRLLDAVYVARRRERAPRLEQRAWLMQLGELAQPDASGQRVAPGVLMVPERALSLNRTAYDLLERCDGRRTLGQIVSALSERHAASAATVERDIATFVAELERRRILSFEPHAGAAPA